MTNGGESPRASEEQPSRVDDVRVSLTYMPYLLSSGGGVLYYTPLISGRMRPDFAGTVPFSSEGALADAMRKLLPALIASLDTERIEIDGDVVRAAMPIESVEISDGWDAIKMYGREDVSRFLLVRGDQLPRGYSAVLDNLRGTAKRLAWQDLRGRLLGAAASGKTSVLISYRRGNERFAEAVAHRLGKEGLLPLYDKWEAKVGDSIPGKIGQWLAESEACVIVVTPDYVAGPWATLEFETAITKAATDGYKVIPLVLDGSPVPELLSRLVRVDFPSDEPEQFELKMVDVINAIFEVELNPYR